MILEQYVKEKLNSRIKDKALTPTGIIKANNIVDIKNLELPKVGAVPQIKKYLNKLNMQPELIKFLGDVSIIVSAISKQNKQDNAKFESVFLDGEPDADTFILKLTPEQSANLEKLNLNQKEVNNIGKNFGELLSGIFLMNRFEPITKIRYPLAMSYPLIDFFAITNNGLEYKISAKYKEGSPAAIGSLLNELEDYIKKHDAKNDWEDEAEKFVYELFKILQKESNPVKQIIMIWMALEEYIPETQKYFDELDHLITNKYGFSKATPSKIVDLIIENKLQKDIYNLFKKVVYLLNNHKKIKTVFNKWVSYVNIHQVYIFNFIINPDFKTIKIDFKIKSFKHDSSEFKFDTKVSLREPWKNGINFQLITN